MIARVAAIAEADARIRFRRTSTLVAFLLLSAIAYLWVPDPSTGRALMRIAGRRALYNSAAIGMATALLGTIFVCLGGYYVISNALRRDIQSRCGFVIAATTIGDGEYVVGKFLGNVLFLSTFFAGFMLVSMAMVGVRGEAPLEVWTFLRQYLLIAPPPIIWVAALAILFESVPALSGRLGDVLYFFLFMVLIAASTVAVGIGGFWWAAYLDPSGMGAVLLQVTTTMHAKSLSIGAGPFDPHLSPIVYPGLSIGGGFLLQRCIALLLPLPLLALARLSFHRFDPARVRVTASERRTWLSRINHLLKPLTQRLFGMSIRSSSSLAGAAWADAVMTVTAIPAVAVLSVAGAVISAFSTEISFMLAGIAVADIACRDAQHGTLPLVEAVPRLREQFVSWKFLSSLILTGTMLIGAIVRDAISNPAALPALITGIVLLTAAATMLGVVSANPKTFIVVFLTFWYIVVNDRGRTAWLDFAGFFSTPSARVTLVYGALSAAFLFGGYVAHAVRLRSSRA